MVRAGEVLCDILNREGINPAGIYYAVAFLHDCNRPLNEYLPVFEEQLRKYLEKRRINGDR